MSADYNRMELAIGKQDYMFFSKFVAVRDSRKKRNDGLDENESMQEEKHF